MGCECSPHSRHAPFLESPPRDYASLISSQIDEYPVLLYSSAKSPDTVYIKGELRKLGVDFECFEVEYMRMGR